jgi:hypothetical protein
MAANECQPGDRCGVCSRSERGAGCSLRGRKGNNNWNLRHICHLTYMQAAAVLAKCSRNMTLWIPTPGRETVTPQRRDARGGHRNRTNLNAENTEIAEQKNPLRTSANRCASAVDLPSPRLVLWTPVHDYAAFLPTWSAGPRRGRFGPFPAPNKHKDRTNGNMTVNDS